MKLRENKINLQIKDQIINRVILFKKRIKIVFYSKKN